MSAVWVIRGDGDWLAAVCTTLEKAERARHMLRLERPYVAFRMDEVILDAVSPIEGSAPGPGEERNPDFVRL